MRRSAQKTKPTPPIAAVGKSVHAATHLVLIVWLCENARSMQHPRRQMRAARRPVSGHNFAKWFKIANFLQSAMELLTARHASNTPSLPLIATVPRFRPWDVFADLSLLSAKRPVVKSVNAIRRMKSNVARSHLRVPFFASRWNSVAAVTLSRESRQYTIICVFERGLVKAQGL